MKTGYRDDIILEVWKSKDKIAARYNHDVTRLVEHLRAEQKSSKTLVVDLYARRRSESRTTP